MRGVGIGLVGVLTAGAGIAGIRALSRSGGGEVTPIELRRTSPTAPTTTPTTTATAPPVAVPPPAPAAPPAPAPAPVPAPPGDDDDFGDDDFDDGGDDDGGDD